MKFLIPINTPDITTSKGFWKPHRSESRILLNIGKGLSRLGFLVDYIYDFNFDEYIYNFDYIITYHHFKYKNFHFLDDMKSISKDRYILVTHKRDKEFVDLNRKYLNDYKLCSSFKTTYLYYKNNYPNLDIGYFPTVYPDPVMYDSFERFDFKLRKNINIFTQIKMAGKGDISESTSLLHTIKKIFSKLGYNVHLHIQTHEDNIQQIRKVLNTATVTGGYTSYDILYENIKACDIGILFLDFIKVSGSQFDFLGLGKPLIVLTDHKYNDPYFFSPLFYEKNYLFWYKEQSESQLEDYIENFINSPELYFNKLRSTIDEYNFINWKEHINELFLKWNI